MKYQTLGMIGILASVSMMTNSAMANVYSPGYYEIDRVEIEEVTDVENVIGNDFKSVENPGKSWRKDKPVTEKPARDKPARGTPRNPWDDVSPWIDDVPTDPIGQAEVILDRIIAIGDKVWKIIDKNKPVVSTTSASLAALPSGAKDWRQLSDWAQSETRVYRMTYKNIYGMTVIDFAFRVAYTYGGTVEGKGKYLANIEIEPRALDVAWGYKFQATGSVVNVHNAGSKTRPVAAAEIKMDWQINTVFKHSQESNRFYLRGDGLFKNLSDGTLPAL